MKSDLFGILNINKPKGLTSFDVVARLRKILKIKQIGHTGTLDPLAQGVLPICVGASTRLIEYFESGKVYRASMILGITTDTYDLEGKVMSQVGAILDKEELRGILKNYIGEITQIPPIYSAVHVNGKRLYEYARQNIEIKEIPSRKVTINSLDIVEIKNDGENPVVVFDVDCSSGTYIRSLISDLGKDLGCGAVMSDLIRLKSGGFCLEDSLTLEEVSEAYEKGTLSFEDPAQKVALRSYELSDEGLKKVFYGQFLLSKDFVEGENLKLLYKGKLAAIGSFCDEKIYPKKVFTSDLSLIL